MSGYNVIGKPTPCLGSLDKVTGRAQYTDDIVLHNPLIVRILRSTRASAKIKEIDTTLAERFPGVKAAITGKDFKNTFGVLPISKDEPAIAKDVVRYIGEPVAAVAAENAKAAEEAMRLIYVKYTDIKPCLDSRQALEKTGSTIHPELKRDTNLHKSAHQQFGDMSEGFKNASAVVEGSFEFKPLNHAFTEPHATQVEIDGSGDLTVYSSTQVPHYLHIALSEVLEFPLHRIRVVKPFLGGGFGGKSDPFGHEMICAKLALMTGRNTKLALSREEVFFTNHGRHPTEIKMKLGLHPECGITALETEALIDGGAYGSFGVVTSYYNGVLLQGPYRVPNFSFKCDRVYTNKPMCGAMRGHGGVNPRFASEVLLDMACVKAGIDPCEARLKFLLQENTITANEFRITSCGLSEGLKTAMERSGWREKYGEKHGKLPYGKGIGVACGFFISGSALPILWNNQGGKDKSEATQSTVRLTIDFDGGVTVYTGASDIGQGSDTVIAMMVAEVLGIPLSMIKIIAADTRLCPVDFGSYSSRVTFMAGNAARNAAIRMRKALTEAACKLMGLPPPVYKRPEEPVNFFRQGGRKPDFSSVYLGPNPDYSDGFIFKDMKIGCVSASGSASGSGKSISYMEAVSKALEGGALQASGIYVSPKMGGKFKGAGAGLSPSYSFTAFITEVSVDPDTGFVKVDKVTCAHDCGTPINPLAVEGQIEGSIHMGLGQALMESMNYVDGAIQNPSFLEYKIPSPFEQPKIDIICPRSDESEGPFGAKEVGEGALAPLVPSVANAIYDAVGIRLMSVPMTPDKVLEAISKVREGGR